MKSIDFRLVFALFISLGMGFSTLFASFWIPDKSKHANEMHLNLASLEPFSSLKLIKLKNGEVLPFDELISQKKDQLVYRFQNQTIQLDLNQVLLENNKPKTEEKLVLLGSDRYGRDYLSRLVLGARVSLMAGFISILISLLIGGLLGLLAGYFGGFLDRIIMWIVNIMWSVPSLLLAIAITLSLGKGMWQVFLAIGLSMWVEVARVLRGKVMEERQKDYVLALQTLGIHDFKILFFYVLPNVFQPIIVICAANFSTAILLEAGLSFLGIGAESPIPTWGKMIKNHYHDIILDKAYLALLPGFCILLLVLAFMSLGNYLKDKWTYN
ncbi:MAG: ABC transporter permease [Flavobacteriales bacterium]